MNILLKAFEKYVKEHSSERYPRNMLKNILLKILKNSFKKYVKEHFHKIIF